MRVLVEVVHPADILFFLRPIRMMKARGDEVVIAARDKDIALTLLDRFGLDHHTLSRQGRGLIGLGRELLARDWALLRLVRRTRPQVMLGFGGVAISHIGRLTGVPAVSFYDTEDAPLQNAISYPLLTHLYVPEDYAGKTPKGRTTRLNGTKDMSFFHPDAFIPDRGAAEAAGLDPARPNIFLRLVDWGANHDIGKSGLSAEEAEALVAALSPIAKLHVSAEGDPPPALRPHLWAGPPEAAHHLMANCAVVAGESATMACEAVALGTPAIYAGADFRGYVEGLARRGLLTVLAPEARGDLAQRILGWIENRADFDRARAEWLAECPDWAEAVVAAADRHARR